MPLRTYAPFPMLRAPLAANASADPLDVIWLKAMLKGLGLYEPPAAQTLARLKRSSQFQPSTAW